MFNFDSAGIKVPLTPPVGVTEKKAEKLAQEYAFEFERHCKGYSLLNENMRFSELADWYTLPRS